MFTYLANLRRKPEAERRAIGAGVAMTIVLTIALIWLATLPMRLGNAGERTSVSADSAATSSEPAPRSVMQDISDIAERAVAPLRQQWESAREQ